MLNLMDVKAQANLLALCGETTRLKKVAATRGRRVGRSLPVLPRPWGGPLPGAALCASSRSAIATGAGRSMTRYPGVMPVEFGESVGQPSRWITLRALRVLGWYSGRE